MSQKKRTPKRRLVYREHTDEALQNEIRVAIPVGGVLWDYFSIIGMDTVDGPTEFARGVQEGRRRLAGELLTVAMSKPEPKVENEQED